MRPFKRGKRKRAPSFRTQQEKRGKQATFQDRLKSTKGKILLLTDAGAAARREGKSWAGASRGRKKKKKKTQRPIARGGEGGGPFPSAGAEDLAKGRDSWHVLPIPETGKRARASPDR